MLKYTQVKKNCLPVPRRQIHNGTYPKIIKGKKIGKVFFCCHPLAIEHPAEDPVCMGRKASQYIYISGQKYSCTPCLFFYFFILMFLPPAFFILFSFFPHFLLFFSPPFTPTSCLLKGTVSQAFRFVLL